MASAVKGMQLGGEGEAVEIDGGYFGGYLKPATTKENRRDRRVARNQTGKRQVVVVMRERGGSTLPAVFKSESAALGFIAARVAKGTDLIAVNRLERPARSLRLAADRPSAALRVHPGSYCTLT